MKAPTAIFMLVMVSATLCQLPQGDIYECNTRLDDFSPCVTALPSCSKYTIEPDRNSNLFYKFVFTCLVCDEGFVQIPGRAADVTKRHDEDIPWVNALPLGYLPLCKRVESRSILTCSTLACRKELPGCAKYTVTNLKSSANIETATFTCVQPRDNFILKDPVVGSIDQSVVKAVVHRVDETRECGVFCQQEFPNCV